MATAPSFTKILREKFPSDLTWLGNLLTPLNSFMSDVSLALANRLTVGQNMDAELKTITCDGVYPITLAWGRTQKPGYGIIGKVEREDGSSVTLPAAITMVWSFNQAGEIEISDVIGLDDTAIKKYILKTIFLVG